MAGTAVVTAVVDSEIEREASEVLADIGLTPSDLLQMALSKVAEHKSLPAGLDEPNAETVAAFEELERGEGSRYSSLEEMYKDLGL